VAFLQIFRFPGHKFSPLLSGSAPFPVRQVLAGQIGCTAILKSREMEATLASSRWATLEQIMYGNPQRRANVDVQELRREGGRWLKECREAAGLSQRELAQLVGAEYYTFISQLETGRGRIPPDRYQIWAEALKIPPKDFVQNVLRFYDPVTYGILFAA
jgi:DNA-binding XRE family transcriptional regulator